VQEVKNLLARVQRDWIHLVHEDIQKRGLSASGTDYPHEYELPDLFATSVRTFPVPETGDFRVELPPEIMERVSSDLQDAIDDGIQTVMEDAMARLLKPIDRAIERLAVPIGEQGSVFRDTLIENVKEGIAAVRSALDLQRSPDTATLAHLSELETTLSTHAPTPDALRHNQAARSKTVDDLAAIKRKMGF